MEDYADQESRKIEAAQQRVEMDEDLKIDESLELEELGVLYNLVVEPLVQSEKEKNSDISMTDIRRTVHGLIIKAGRFLEDGWFKILDENSVNKYIK